MHRCARACTRLSCMSDRAHQAQLPWRQVGASRMHSDCHNHTFDTTDSFTLQMSGKPPLDPVLPAAPLIDRPGSRPPSTEPATARPSTKAIGPLPEGLSCWLATQCSTDVEATLTGIRKGFLRHYSQHGTTTTAKAADKAERNGSSHDNALEDKQVGTLPLCCEAACSDTGRTPAAHNTSIASCCHCCCCCCGCCCAPTG
jgi:hypothetical protein